jgi:uncharacterized membrane protein YeiH
MLSPDSILQVLLILGNIAAAMTAALAAGRRKMDWVGVALLGAITALGGGPGSRSRICLR